MKQIMNLGVFFLFTFLSSASAFAGDCSCDVLGESGVKKGSYRECKNSIGECRSWCEKTYNPGGNLQTEISYESGKCPSSCGNIYVKPHVEFSAGKKWKVCSGYMVSFQGDGNLVVYNPSGKAVWASNTNGRGGKKLAMQYDGNLVIYTADYKPVWASNTHGKNGSVLVIQEDGNVVIYNTSNQSIWETRTNGK